MKMTDPHDLIQRLAPVVSTLAEEYSGYSDLAQEVRAYLAAPDEPAVPDGREPTDEDLFNLADCHAENHGWLSPNEAVDYARAVLARWGSR